MNKKPKPMSSRAVALEIMRAVLHKRQPFDEVIAANEGFKNLAPRDRAFTHLMVATVLRRLGQIDEAIKSCLDKQQDLKAVALDILRLGAAQLLFIETPPHAAVDTAVELAASNNATAPYKGLVNAVLRRLSREGKAIVEKQDAGKLNVPEWIMRSLEKSYGNKISAKTAQALLEEAAIDLSAKTDAALWAEKLGAELLPTGSLRLPKETEVGISELPGFETGKWWVQDAAAAIPAKLFGDVGGKGVVDLCAAPGGKTMQLAAMGARVVAVDRSEKRLERLKENLVRMGLSAEIACVDGAKFKPKEKAEFVLLDAPCSATGTARRNPDVLRIKNEADVARLAELQKKLLDHAFEEILASGGVLIYSVCSLQPEEAEEQIEEFLKNHKSARRIPIHPDEIGGCAELLTKHGDLRCLPCHWPERGGLDGFFAARIGKRG